MYKFTLEPLLNYRKFVEENIQKELALCKRQLLHERKKLNTYQDAKHKVANELKTRQEKGAKIIEVLLYARFIEQLSRDIEEQKKKVFEAEEKLNQKRDELIGAMKDRKTLEKLKENGLKVYRKDLLRKEQGFLGEIAINRFNRKMLQG